MPDTTSQRRRHLDLLRGLIMLLMALDHASYFIAKVHPSEFWSTPLPIYTSALAFLTRFASHLCAPGFFFLTGAGMELLAGSRRQLGWTEDDIRKHYLVRGLLLMVLQVLVENAAWALGSRGGGGGSTFVYFGVLYGLGASMAAGVLLRRLPATVLLGLGVAALTATQLLVSGILSPGDPLSPAIRLLIVPGRTSPVVVLYPVLPWLGLTLIGMAYGRQVAGGRETPCWTACLGAACLFGFAVLRIGGGFGNTHPVDASNMIGFLSVTKYPPSLTFVLLTLGLDLLLLAFFDSLPGAVRGWLNPLAVFGRSALFFYLAHLYLYALIGKALAEYEISLGEMYPVWAAGVLILYPLCLGYGRFKRTTAPNSPWRLL